jgi:hypothetical protein
LFDASSSSTTFSGLLVGNVDAEQFGLAAAGELAGLEAAEGQVGDPRLLHLEGIGTARIPARAVGRQRVGACGWAA